MKIALGCVYYRLPKTNYEHFKKHLLNLAQKSDWLFTGFYRIIFFKFMTPTSILESEMKSVSSSIIFMI